MKNISLSLALVIAASTISPAVFAVSPVNIKPIQNNKKLLDKTKRLPKRTLSKTPLKDKVPDLVEQTDTVANQLVELSPIAPVILSTGVAGPLEERVEGGYLAIVNEWVGLLSEAQLAIVKKLPISQLKQHSYSGLDLLLVSFRVPSELDSLNKLSELLPADITQRLDRNHVFAPQAKPNPRSTSNKPISSANTRKVAKSCQQPIALGMVDTAIAKNHPYLAGKQLVTKNFLAKEFIVPTDHATAVAGRLISTHPSAMGIAPNATIYAASVFYNRTDSTQGASLINLISGLNWLAQQDLKVINLSLTGPDNKILLAAISRLIAKDFSLVAAAGNEGPASPPLYPAAYDGVVAVTAIDKNQKIYRWANQGDYIDFAGLGVEVLTTQANQSIGEESGTSLASPEIAALIGCQRFENSFTHQQAKNQLIEKATDLGQAGRDKIFGHGVIE